MQNMPQPPFQRPVTQQPAQAEGPPSLDGKVLEGLFRTLFVRHWQLTLLLSLIVAGAGTSAYLIGGMVWGLGVGAFTTVFILGVGGAQLNAPSVTGR